MQQSYLCQKNQNYLQGKANLRFFLSYSLRTTIKITIYSVLFMLSCYSQNSSKKVDSFNRTFFEVKMKPPKTKQMLLKGTTYIMVRKKQNSFCEIAP